MVKKNITILFSCLYILIYASNNLSAQEQIKNKLSEAYKDSSCTLIKIFFEEWENEIKPISIEEYNLLSDTVKNVYKVFNSFCNYILKEYPYKFKDTPYYLVQNQIEYTISNKKHLSKKAKDSTITFTGEIKNFRPFLKLLNKKIIYLSPSYETALDSFIINESDINPRSKDFFKTPWPGWPRARFLSKMVQIRASLIAFHYYTLPYISVQFNNMLNEVIIDSNLGNIWMSDKFILSKGVWIYKESLNFLVE